MFRSKKLEIQKKNVKTVKEPSDENQTECHEIEPTPSKDRAMPDGNDPSFLDNKYICQLEKKHKSITNVFTNMYTQIQSFEMGMRLKMNTTVGIPSKTNNTASTSVKAIKTSTKLLYTYI
jgi:hypothetical protein